MMDFTLKILTEEERVQQLKDEIAQDGLLKAVEKRCDDINELTSTLSYLPRRSVQEDMVEIMDLIKLKEQ